MGTLNEHLSEELNLLDEVVKNEGEISDDLEILIRDSSDQLSKKIDNYLMVLDRLSSEEEIAERRAEHYMRLAKSYKGTREGILERVKYLMLAFNRPKLKGEFGGFVLRKTKPKVDLAKGMTLEDIPKKFTREKITRSLDKERALAEHEKHPGVFVVTESHSITPKLTMAKE